MAVTNFTVVRRMRGVNVTTWAAIPNGNSGLPQNCASYNDKCVQVTGTFASATFSIEGSNDGVTYFALHDPAGAALTFTSAGLKEILENPVYIRPGLSSAGDGTTSLTVVLAQRSGYI